MAVSLGEVLVVLSEAILKHARTYLGVHEEPPGSNDGPLIRQWLHNVGVEKPAPWCCAFAWSMVQFACGDSQLPNPLYRTASSHALWERTGTIYRVSRPQPGGLVVFEHLNETGHPDGRGHVCIVASVQGHLVTTIDGNSDEKGGRTGGQVVELTWDFQSGRRGRLRVLGCLYLEMQI